MREKLIEFIRKADKEDYESRTQDEHYAYMADHLIANGVTFGEDINVHSKWIPVSERLPEDHTERVLVKIKDGNNIIGHPDMDTDRYLEDMWVRWGHNVTHWMPLPEPPKGEE